MKLFVWAIPLFWATVSVGQNTKIGNSNLPNYNPPWPSVSPGTTYQPSIEQRNQAFIEEDMRQYQLQKSRQKSELNAAYRELGIDTDEKSEPLFTINYSYPKNQDAGIKYFEKAFDEISGMIKGNRRQNLKRAVFLTEHAFDTTLNYQQFERQISAWANVIYLEMQQRHISRNDNLGKIMTVFKFMADTLIVRNPSTNKMITTYPKQYDFEDFYGIRDYHKVFVSKLIKTNKGQCHSMSLLFLILCQEINANAYLSFSPEHCYIKFLDKNENLQNIELTNQMFTTDQFILQSGYITSAAIKSGIYMDTLGTDRVINHMLNDLANNYVKKYGYDDFALKCSNQVLFFDSKSIRAYMHAANYYTLLGRSIENQYQKHLVPRGYYFEKDNAFRVVVKQAIKWGKLIDELGYAQMPPEIYSEWLNTLKNESFKQQHLERRSLLNAMMEN